DRSGAAPVAAGPRWSGAGARGGGRPAARRLRRLARREKGGGRDSALSARASSRLYGAGHVRQPGGSAADAERKARSTPASGSRRPVARRARDSLRRCDGGSGGADLGRDPQAGPRGSGGRFLRAGRAFASGDPGRVANAQEIRSPVAAPEPVRESDGGELGE